MVKRQQQKLVLSGKEISLIKGLVEHANLNDQMIVSIFSHKSRTINHREISYIRDPHNTKYSEYKTATKKEVQDLLKKYDQFEIFTKIYGLQPKEDHFQKVQKSVEAMKNAVGIYNNPNIFWKSENYIINAMIAWTYLMHAYYDVQGIDYIYKKSGEPVLTDEGRPKLWELNKCLKANECPLPKLVKKNLQYIIAIRNEVEHSGSQNLDQPLGPKLQACALNFNHWLREWFGDAFDISEFLSFSIQFSSLTLSSHSDLKGKENLPDTIKTVNTLIENDLSSEEYNNPQYSYRVFVIPKTINNKNKADQAVTYAPLGSDLEMAVREVERHKYTAGDIVDIMKQEGFENFSTHGKDGFVKIWQKYDAKKPGKGFGVEVAGRWLWYESMLDVVRKELQQRNN